MFKPVRVVATLIFLGSIVLIFVGAFVIGSDVSTPRYMSTYAETYYVFPDPLHQCVPFRKLSGSLTNRSAGTVFVIIEYLAYTWYTLSYIPYARSAVRSMVGLAV